MTDNKNDLKNHESHLAPEMVKDDFHGKQQLLKLIIEQGILHDSAERPVIARDGKTRLSWVMNFLAISLHADSLRLAAQETLKLLETFDGRQLATIGTAAVPLLSACILESQGKYNGLMVRAKRKTYGTASLIDGRINYAESVIVIDDSIGSGSNMMDCIDKLEESGLHVEGCICLVRFGYDSGYGKLIDRGYRVAALFDIHQDISPHHPNDWQYIAHPIKDSFKNIVWDEQCLPDYIPPFKAIRQSMAHYWQTGRLLRPPQIFNQPIDTAGGIWLSLRAQDAVYTSQGRHGFWHFPEEIARRFPGGADGEIINAGLDVSRVAWLFASHMQADPHREQRLAQSAFGLSLFGALENCEVGEFDQHQHALVIRSDEAPWRMGGALPNMPGIRSDAHLLHHACFNNTKLYRHEPFQLYRHTVSKLVEPGAEWPSGGESREGQSWDESQGIVQPIAEQLLSWVKAWHHDRKWPDAVSELYIPAECQWLFLSVYLRGTQVACVGTIPQKAGDLLHLVKNAAQDSRWPVDSQPSADSDLYIRVSMLSQSRYLGCAAHLQSFANFSLGQDALAIQRDEKFAIVLPEVPVQQQWSVEQLNGALYQKAGITQQSKATHWRSYRTTTWHVDHRGCHHITPEKPLPPAALATFESVRTACHGFLCHHRQTDGKVNSNYNPILHQARQQDVLLNTAYILWLSDIQDEAIDEAIIEWQHCYQYLVQQLQNEEINHLERSYTILALLKRVEANAEYRALLAKQLELLQGAFNAHGQLSNPEGELVKDHYGIELRVLFTAQQFGFLIDERVLKKAFLRLLNYARYQILPRQYPSLISLLSLAVDTNNVQPDLVGKAGEVKEVINKLARVLLSRQQSSGAFVPEAPHLSPVFYTLQAIDALLDADFASAGAIKKAVSYLEENVVQPEHKIYFPAGLYAVGGLYSGLLEGSFRVADTALFLKVITRLNAGEASA